MRMDQFKAHAERSLGLLGAAIRFLVREGRLVQDGQFFHPPGFSARLPARDEVLWSRVQEAMGTFGSRPPLVNQLADYLDEDPQRLSRLLESLEHMGQVVGVGDQRYFMVRTLGRLTDALGKLAEDGGMVSTSAFRDVSGLGRNLAIEVLEHFDTMGITQRVGDARRFLGPQRADTKPHVSGQALID